MDRSRVKCELAKLDERGDNEAINAVLRIVNQAERLERYIQRWQVPELWLKAVWALAWLIGSWISGDLCRFREAVWGFFLSVKRFLALDPARELQPDIQHSFEERWHLTQLLLEIRSIRSAGRVFGLMASSMLFIGWSLFSVLRWDLADGSIDWLEGPVLTPIVLHRIGSFLAITGICWFLCFLLYAGRFAFRLGTIFFSLRPSLLENS